MVNAMLLKENVAVDPSACICKLCPWKSVIVFSSAGWALSNASSGVKECGNFTVMVGINNTF
jgi:hypothetical protein